MNWKIAAALTLALLIAFGGHSSRAQAQDDPVLTPFRAYQAALSQGDLAAAESAAAQAYAASNARDGDGGATAVLAFNLALARLTLHRPADAIEPARRALALANSGARGVDPLRTRLVLGEAELTQDDRAARARLQAALAEADAQPGETYDADAYSAALALAQDRVTHRSWSEALAAWESVIVHANGAGGNVDFARGNALLGKGVAQLFLRRIPEGYVSISVAQQYLQQFRSSAPSDDIALGEVSYAMAVAWQRVARAAFDDQMTMPNVPDLPGPARIAPDPNSSFCPSRVVPGTMPRYPRDEAASFGVGAVVVRIRTDAEGQIVSAHVVASAPNPAFAAEVERVVGQFHIEWAPNPPANCTRQSNSILVPVMFSMSR